MAADARYGGIWEVCSMPGIAEAQHCTTVSAGSHPQLRVPESLKHAAGQIPPLLSFWPYVQIDLLC